MDQAMRPDGLTRRRLLTRTVVALAAVAGLTALAQQKFFGKQITPTQLELPEDSIFTPRADQRRKILGE